MMGPLVLRERTGAERVIVMLLPEPSHDFLVKRQGAQRTEYHRAGDDGEGRPIYEARS